VQNYPLRPLALLCKARALALAGDVNGSRDAYRDFLALWKNGDSDLKLLQEARAEYGKLQ
jgi:hypothetical protein